MESSLMSGCGLRWQDRAAGEISQGVLQPAPMRSPCFATVTREGAVLDPARRDIEPPRVNEHLYAAERQTVRHRAAVGVIAAG